MHKLNLSALAACAALALLAPAAPAAAGGVSVIATDCVSVSHADGCLFSGNIAPNTISGTENAYNLFNDTHPTAAPDIDLNFLFKSDDAGFLGTVTGSTLGTWSTPGFLIDFVAVKSSNNFVLYKLATPASSGSWDTLDIPYKNNPKDLSHLTFFGSAAPPLAVPEPATWAMMLMGFGGMGALLRRSRRLARTACA